MYMSLLVKGPGNRYCNLSLCFLDYKMRIMITCRIVISMTHYVELLVHSKGSIKGHFKN